MGITILDGDLGTYAQVQPAPGGMKYWDKKPGKLLPQRKFAAVEKLEFLQANESGGGFSPLWGAVGMETIGPAGLLLGANGKRSKEKIFFRCTLRDGRAFVGSMPAAEYRNWHFLLTNRYAESINAVVTATVICGVLAFFVWLITLM